MPGKERALLAELSSLFPVSSEPIPSGPEPSVRMSSVSCCRVYVP